ncbi:MAG: hypothetical protein JNL58_08505 [Planctomyces sp.]|nr:hypothetical protein [Planctomyces sp.]
MSKHDDLNWYAPNTHLSRPKKKPIWPWILLAVFLLMIVAGGTVALLISRRLGDQSLAEFLESGELFDDSRVKSQFDEREKARLRASVAGFQQTATSGPAISDDDRTRVMETLKKLESAMMYNNSEEYNKLFDRTGFSRRVLDSGYLSRRAREEMASQFTSWLEMYPGFDCSELRLVRLDRSPDDNTIHAYTWVYGQDYYPYRVVWHFDVSPAGAFLVDYEAVERAFLYSEETAREFSSAFTEGRWDNYRSLYESDAEDLDTATLRAKLTEDAGRIERKFPKAMHESTLVHLATQAQQAREYEISIRIADQLKAKIPLPICDWLRAYACYQLNRNDEALSALGQFVDAVGEGPDTYVLRAQIFQNLEQRTRAAENYAQALRLHPNSFHLPADFRSVFQLDDVPLLIEIAKSSEQPASTVTALALKFIDDRIEISEKLAEVVFEGTEKTADRYLLEGKIAASKGDFDGASNLIKQGWQLIVDQIKEGQPSDELQQKMYSLQYEWEQTMSSAGKRTEIITESLNPVGSFISQTIDESELMITVGELKVFVEALNSVAPQNEADRSKITLWQSVANGLLLLETGHPEEAWEVLNPVCASIADPRTNIGAVLDEDVGQWVVTQWCGEAGVRSGKTKDAFQLLTKSEESDPFPMLAATAIEFGLGHELNAVIRLQEEQDSTHQMLAYYRIYSDLLANRYSEARAQLFRQIIEDPDRTGMYSLVFSEYFAGPEDRDAAFSELPPETAYKLFVDSITEPASVGDAESLVDLAKSIGLSKAATLPLETQICEWKRDNVRLRELYSEWIQLPPEASVDPDALQNSWMPENQAHLERFHRMFIETGDLEEARRLVANLEARGNGEPLPPYSMLSRLKHVNELFQQGAEEVLKQVQNDPSGGETISQRLYNFPNNPLTKVPEWDAIRNFSPPYLGTYSTPEINGMGTTELVVLQSSSEPFSRDFINQRLVGVDAELEVTDLTDLRNQLLNEARQSSDENQADRVEIRLVRIRTSAGSFKLLQMAALPKLVSETMIGNSGEAIGIAASLPDDLKTALISSKSLFRIQIEQLAHRASLVAIQQQLLKIANAMTVDDSSILWNEDKVSLFSRNNRERLSNGLFPAPKDNLAFQYFSIDELDSWADWNQSRDVNRLRRYLSSHNPDEFANGIPVWILIYGREYPVSCRLVSWELQSNSSQLVIETDGSEILPESEQNSRFRSSIWNVSRWTAPEDAAVSQPATSSQL